MEKIKYNFFKNTSYALSGLIDVFKHEKSFKIELIIVVILWIVLYFAKIDFIYKSILAISLFLPLLAEIANSAIERVVDLVTSDIHPLAKSAKDVGSAMVFVSIVICVCIWASVFYVVYIF